MCSYSVELEANNWFERSSTSILCVFYQREQWQVCANVQSPGFVYPIVLSHKYINNQQESCNFCTVSSAVTLAACNPSLL